MLKLLIRIALLCSFFIIVSSGDGVKKIIDNGITFGLDKIKEITSPKSKKYSTENPLEKTTDKAQKKTTEKALEKTTVKALEKTTEKPLEKITEKATGNAAVKTTENAPEKTTVKTTEKALKYTTYKALEKTTDKTPEKTTENAPEKTTENAPKKTTDTTSEKTTGKPVEEKVTEKPQSNENHSDKSKCKKCCKHEHNDKSHEKKRCGNDKKSHGENSDGDNNKAKCIKVSEPTSSSKCYEEALSLILPANIVYSGKILKELIQLHPSENVLHISPVTWYLLGQVGISAHGDAYTQIITKIFNFKNVKLVKCFFQRILPIISNVRDVDFKYIGKIYSDDVCPLNSDFRKQTKDVFMNEPTNLDFQDPKSAKYISEEIAESTNNGILNYIKPSFLARFSGLLLVTATYFQGQWQKPFNPIYTEERDFYVSICKPIKVKTMYQKGTFLYGDSSELGAKILKMKYINDDFSLVIMLPICIQGLTEVVDNIRNPDLVTAALDSLKEETVEIYLPTFNVTVANRLKVPLEKMNVTNIFHNKTAGLEDITPCRGTYVSNFLQKASLQIDENGGMNAKKTDFNTEESTEGSTEESSEGNHEKSYIFRADRPFLYFLFYQKFIVYIGVHNH